LGHGLPAAVGVALARPDKRVIALLGDGSSLYSIQGLWSAAQLNLPIAFVIVRNGRYEALNDFRRHFALEHLPGIQLPGIDFCSLAQAQGLQALRVEKLSQLDAALTSAFKSDKPILVEVVTAEAAPS
jgi:benzoylformate decarboxylase